MRFKTEEEILKEKEEQEHRQRTSLIVSIISVAVSGVALILTLLANLLLL